MAKGERVSENMVIGIFEMIKRRPEITNTELAQAWDRPENTIIRIRSTGSFEGWKQDKERKAEKERERAEQRKKQTKNQLELVYDESILEEYRREQEAKAEEQLPGQICMELDTTGAEQKYTTVQVQIPADEPLVLVNEQKMMRFLAGKFDVIEKRQALGVEMINMKLDKLNDTLSMILRAVRKE